QSPTPGTQETLTRGSDVPYLGPGVPAAATCRRQHHRPRGRKREAKPRTAARAAAVAPSERPSPLGSPLPAN
uniref:Uncharacterized protein n=1 Tax=Moschus moschiferus TaxID=68415 RepID=A0A8C6CRF2_MOSMO